MGQLKKLHHEEIEQMENDAYYNQWADKMYEQDREHQMKEENDDRQSKIVE